MMSSIKALKNKNKANKNLNIRFYQIPTSIKSHKHWSHLNFIFFTLKKLWCTPLQGSTQWDNNISLYIQCMTECLFKLYGHVNYYNVMFVNDGINHFNPLSDPGLWYHHIQHVSSVDLSSLFSFMINPCLCTALPVPGLESGMMNPLTNVNRNQPFCFPSCAVT